jgi:hypothetical protein
MSRDCRLVRASSGWLVFLPRVSDTHAVRALIDSQYRASLRGPDQPAQ